ncbi:MAG: M23 family metallopeptidase [Candidatus Absconditabacterales bacterium]
MPIETTETKTDVTNTENDTLESSEVSTSLEETKEEVADLYLDLLDQKKGGLLSVAGSLNPLRKVAKENLLATKTKAEKLGFFDKIGKNIEKRLNKIKEEVLGKVTGSSGLTYTEEEKKKLETMKGLLASADKTKLDDLKAQIEAGTDPAETPDTTTTNPDTETADKTAIIAGAAGVGAIITSPSESKEASTTYVAPFEKDGHTFIMSPFGLRNGEEHDAVDISAPAGTEIKSITGGEVIDTGYSAKTNYYIKIQTPDKKKTLTFVHLKKNLPFEKGKIVKPDDVIGYIGTQKIDKYRTGPHLHLSVYDNDEKKFINPAKDKDLTPIIALYPVYKAAA